MNLEELRQSHCDRKEKHSCIGALIITRHGTFLACDRCGANIIGNKLPTTQFRGAAKIVGEEAAKPWEQL